MLKLLPNILTLGRFVLTVIFLIMILLSPPRYAQGELPFPDFLDIAFILFVIAGLTDMVDGAIARKLGVASKFGRMMDPLADKALVCGSFICFAIIGQPKLFGLPDTTMSIIQWAVAGIIILREAYVTILRHVAEAAVLCHRNGHGKNGPRPDRCMGILVHRHNLCYYAGSDGIFRHKGHSTRFL